MDSKAHVFLKENWGQHFTAHYDTVHNCVTLNQEPIAKNGVYMRRFMMYEATSDADEIETIASCILPGHGYKEALFVHIQCVTCAINSKIVTVNAKF